ncbi:MAG TPA: topoisomerase DNA-binding C4 zinc finger domain-containing protein, partial [Burkholderiales bacterium]|nr:topoisomerase DNA-binding C4 zinc finger domain-containing protein [Burkholderiales bacterium]
KQGFSRAELVGEKLDENCPDCGKQLIMRFGKYGKFIGCSGYPECKYMRKVTKDNASEEIEELQIISDRLCPKDEGTLVIRNGRFGKFISCKNYPKCKYIENIDKPASEAKSLNITCPECKTGHIVEKKNRYGNWFYACDNYPSCKTIFNHKPIAETCPNCKYTILLHKITKRNGEEKICPNCDYVKKL